MQKKKWIATFMSLCIALSALTSAACSSNKNQNSNSSEQSSSSSESSSPDNGGNDNGGNDDGGGSEDDGGNQDGGDQGGGGDGGDQGGNGGGNDNPQPTKTYTDFTAAEKALFGEYDFAVLPFLANDEYYLEEYADEDLGEVGLNFYTYGNTKAEFTAYLGAFSDYESAGTDVDDYGDTWYFFDKADYYVDLAWYVTEGNENVVDVYIYREDDGTQGGGSTGGGSEDDGGDTGGSTGGSTDNADVITNKGKGLPAGTNGVYNVDFTKAKYVKNVTEQGYYLGGCPTTGSPKVLVIPVEFSDVTAKSKDYEISKIKAAFTGGTGETDYYSVHDYYYQSSYGKLDLDITVLDEWFKPSKNSSYYEQATMDYYGEETPIGDQMIMDEALQYLDSKLDLSQFDSDNNDMIDAVVLISTLEIDGESDFHWAYRYWNIYTNNEDYYYEYDGVSANDYLWASYQFLLEEGEGYNDNALNTYTYIHEFGHILGADDYYDTSYEGAPMDGYDIMDSMIGDHNAYTKFNYGWLTSSRLVTAQNTVTLTLEDFSKNGDTIILANNWDDDLGAYQEYYVLVYYTNNGLNAGDAGYFNNAGVVVYHVNASLYKEVSEGETYYDVYNNNTDVSSEDGYGTADNLIEFVKSTDSEYVYAKGDSISANTKDDQGNKLAYTFTVDSLTSTSATITFTKNGSSSGGSTGGSTGGGTYEGDLPWV